MSQQLSIEKIEEMWDAFLVKQSASFVTRECGVNKKTSLRYINAGDPKRNITAFRERFAALMKLEEEKKDEAEARERTKNLKMIREYKKKMEKALQKKTISPDDVTVREVDKLLRLYMKMAKEESEVNRQHGPQLDYDVISALPPELIQSIAHIIVEYQQTGNVPKITIERPSDKEEAA